MGMKRFTVLVLTLAALVTLGGQAKGQNLSLSTNPSSSCGAILRSASDSQEKIDLIVDTFGDRALEVMADQQRHLAAYLDKHILGETQPIFVDRSGQPLNFQELHNAADRLLEAFSGSLGESNPSSYDQVEMSDASNKIVFRKIVDQAKRALQNPVTAEMANEVNRLFQDKAAILQFFSRLQVELFLSVAKVKSGLNFGQERSQIDQKVADRMMYLEAALGSTSFAPWYSKGVGRHLISRLTEMGVGLGWKGIKVFDDESTEDFLEITVGKLLLPNDQGGVLQSGHPQHGHLLQLVFATEQLEKKFGAERTLDFMRSMATGDGRGIFYFLFDRGPGFTRDLRGPHFLRQSDILRMLDLK